MYLSKLLLRDFGKFHNDELSLSPGMNVIDGNEDSGESDIAGFISGIFYGIRKRPVEDGKKGEYERYKPEGQSRYSGTGYLKKDDKSYLIDRTFLSGAKRTSVMEVQSGREVILKNADSLVGTLMETDKYTYQDTRIIAEPEESAAESLKTFLGNKIETGSGELNKREALKYLEKEKEKNDPQPLIRRLESLNEQIEAYDFVDEALEKNKQAMQQLTEDFAIEAEKRKRVARQLVENEDGTITYKSDEELDRKMDRLKEAEKNYGASELTEEEGEPKKKLSDNFFVILLTGLFVVGVITGIVYLIPFEDAVRKLFIIFTAIFVVITILTGFKDKGYFDDGEGRVPDEEDFNRVLAELEEEKDHREEDEFDITFAREYSDKKDQLKAEEKELLEKKSIREKLKKEQSQVFKKKTELDDEINAINLAISTIENLSKEYRSKAAKSFVPHLSKYVAALTGNAYAAVVFDERDGLSVDGYNGRSSISALPEEMARRVYLAVRLSIARYMSEEQLPLVIQDMIDFTSAEDAGVFLEVLRDMEQEQIVLLTGNKYIRMALDAKQMKYNYVQLG